MVSGRSVLGYLYIALRLEPNLLQSNPGSSVHCLQKVFQPIAKITPERRACYDPTRNQMFLLKDDTPEISLCSSSHHKIFKILILISSSPLPNLPSPPRQPPRLHTLTLFRCSRWQPLRPLRQNPHRRPPHLHIPHRCRFPYVHKPPLPGGCHRRTPQYLCLSLLLR